MSERRIFTIEEVNGLIPSLSQLVGAQLLAQAEIEQRIAELAQISGGLPESLNAAELDSPEVARLKAELRSRVARYESGWRTVQKLGAIVKDPQIGLVDFYGKIEGRLVWLCWRYGEESLEYYHELDAGYAGRRKLLRTVRERLLN